MEHGEYEIKGQRRVESRRRQGIQGPPTEQAKDGEAGDGLGGGHFPVEPDERDGPEIHQKHEAEDQPRTLGEGGEIQKPGGEGERDGRQAQARAGKPRIDLIPPLRPPIRRQKECMETQKNPEGGENFIPGKIFLTHKKIPRPAHLEDGRAEGGEGGQEMPAPVEGDDQQAGVQHGDVAKQPEGVVLAGGQQHGRQKPAQQAENGHHQRLQPHGHQESREGDQDHQHKRRHRPEKFKVIYGAAGEGDGVENDHARGAQRVRQRRKVFARQPHPAGQQTQSGEEPRRHAQFGRHQIVVERIFDEERDSEEQRESPGPGKTFDPHELFPVELGRGRAGRGGDGFHRRLPDRRSLRRMGQSLCAC